jgi:hypothetical protein
MREFIRLQAGLNVSDAVLNFSYEPRCISGEILFPKKKGALLRIPDRCPYEWAKEFKVYSKVGDKLLPPKELADRIADIPLLIASNEEEFKERVYIAYNWFYENTIIEEQN